MKLDPIVKEELWRSTAIFFISVIIVAVVITTGPFPIPAFLLFPLALAITAVFFCVMVWYRRKENLADPNPISILHHALRPGERREEKTQQMRGAVDKVVDAVLAVVIFLIYLYASRAYSINQVLWLPVLLIIGMFLARIVFTGTVNFLDDFSGSQAVAATAADAEAVFSIEKNGSEVGTITFAASGDTGSFASDNPVQFDAGDVLRLVAPGPQDADLAGISITLAGTR